MFLKTLKKNNTILKLSGKLFFFKDVPIREFLHFPKLRLILVCRSYTFLTYRRLSRLYEAALDLEEEGLAGDLVECGVWKGGSAGMIASAAKNTSRQIWLFDSWEGFPEPTKDDITFQNQPVQKGMILSSKKTAEKLLFQKLKLDRQKIRLVKGWFTQTIPPCKKNIRKIALLHLDCDLYSSVKFCLEHLYDRVVKGGYIFIDDYGHWRGSQKAVDEFIKKRKLKVKLQKIDYSARYFRK